MPVVKSEVGHTELTCPGCGEVITGSSPRERRQNVAAHDCRTVIVL